MGAAMKVLPGMPPASLAVVLQRWIERRGTA
jgi:hypothetical protein